MLSKSVKLSMHATIGGIRKGLILWVFLASICPQKVFAQCDALFSYSIDSVRGSIQFSNLSVKAHPDSTLYSTWLDTSGNVLSNSTNPLLYMGEGSFEVCLSIVNAGCTDSSCQTIIMPAPYCVADFTYSVDQTGMANFVSLSIGNQTAHFWSFGDGAYAADSVASHTFATNGWYYVCLNTSNADSSCMDVHCEFVRVNKPSPEPCVAEFEYEYDTANTKRVYFKNLTTSDSTITYVWLFGDDATSDQKDPSHLFNNYGNYQVCLLVSGPNCADSVCKTVEILLILPFCEAAFETQLFSDSANQTARIAVFTNQSIGENLEYLWSFGDDSTSSETMPIHYYPQNGTYTVCLTVLNGALCTDSICSFVEISPQTGIEQLNRDAGLKVYPIPVADQLNIEWQMNTDGASFILLADMQGRIIDKQMISMVSGVNKTSINTQNLSAGMYTLMLHTAEGAQKVKILKY